MCQKLLPTSFIRPHNHQDELSTPWATLLKTFAGYTWMEKEPQAMHTQDPCRAGDVHAVLSQAEPPGRAGGCSAPAPHQAVPEAGTCISSSSALACTDTTKPGFSPQGHAQVPPETGNLFTGGCSLGPPSWPVWLHEVMHIFLLFFPA